MIQFGNTMGFVGFNAPQTQPQQQAPAQNPGVPSHTTTNSTMMVAAQPMYPVAVMTPAYMMAFPQMSGAMGMAPMASGGMATMPGASPATEASGGGHVTANPTNSLATQAPSAATGGYGGYGGIGAFGGFGMPVMMMSPVFVQMGFPMVFQGSVAQPTQTNEPAAVVPEVPVVESVPEAVTAPPVNTEGAVVDVVPTSSESPTSLPSLSISEMNAEDFSKYRSIEKSRQQETSLKLELTTKDGDKISLDFSQIDAMEMSQFRGRTLDGQQVKDSKYHEESERVVNMDVFGDLSDAEKAAVDKVMSTIVEVVNSFFTGDVGQAVEKLKQMDFDGQQLAELSLNMSMSKSANITKAYHNGGDQLHDLKNRDADIGQALEFIATEQKRLVDMAKDFFDAPSAARLVRSLVPPMMAEPFSQLSQQIASANQIEAPAEDGSEETDVEEDSSED